MKYYYDELNQRAKLKARLDYFDKHKTTDKMIETLFRSMFDVNGAIYE